MPAKEPTHRINPILLERARAMRHDPAPAEQKLWRCLRNRKLNGYKFRRQVPIGPFIADFYCSEVSLIVELDGDTHAQTRDYDASRSQWFTQNGYELIRFINHYVHRELDIVLLTILRHCDDRSVAAITGRTPHPNPLP